MVGKHGLLRCVAEDVPAVLADPVGRGVLASCCSCEGCQLEVAE